MDTKKVTCYGCLKSYPISVSLIRRIENNELPINRAKIEIFEEVGIKQEYITLIKSSNEITVESPQYANHQWIIFPFFFKTDTNDIKLNWENSEFRWIDIQELKEFNTVPSLEKILLSLL